MARIIFYSVIFVVSVFGIWVMFLDGKIGNKDSIFTPVTKTKEVGYRGYAARNKLLAVHRFLESKGETVRSQRRLFGIFDNLGKHDYLILLSHGRNIPRHEIISLMRWVSRGGQLVVGPRRIKLKAKHDVLFEKLRIIQIKAPAKSTNKLLRYGNSDTLDIDFDNPIRLKYTGRRDSQKVRDKHGVLVYRIDHGVGRVTVLSDISIFSNKEVGLRDHAVLFNLVTKSQDKVKYWFIYGSDSPSLFEILLKYLWPFLVAIASIFLLWIWKAFNRFGPVQKSESLHRRSLLEHIRGAGSIQWKMQGREQLFIAVHRTLYRRIELRHPDWLLLKETDLIHNLSEVSHVPENKVDNAIQAHKINGEHDFFNQVQILIKIRNSL